MQLLCVFFGGWAGHVEAGLQRLAEAGEAASRIWGMHRACSPWKIESSPSLAFLPREMKNDQQRFCVGKCKKKRCIIIPQSEIPNIPGDIFPLLPHRAPHLQIPFFLFFCASMLCPIGMEYVLVFQLLLFSTFFGNDHYRNEHRAFSIIESHLVILLDRYMQGKPRKCRFYFGCKQDTS